MFRSSSIGSQAWSLEVFRDDTSALQVAVESLAVDETNGQLQKRFSDIKTVGVVFAIPRESTRSLYLTAVVDPSLQPTLPGVKKMALSGISAVATNPENIIRSLNGQLPFSPLSFKGILATKPVQRMTLVKASMDGKQEEGCWMDFVTFKGDETVTGWRWHAAACNSSARRARRHSFSSGDDGCMLRPRSHREAAGRAPPWSMV
ncbi:hypothetical protein CMUS01_07806 [Colletotrichum musicola]|uniref:Uncharacterized protein n=1 Tax=Colletotrichum musicola TaxID=2175873 RepID=A0A8H6KF33_9PEZI|nr:hypothetical protein CMUS01_07806 [Colletotrichum musicola]